MSDSRISGLYRISVSERIDDLQQRGWLSSTDAELLRQGRHLISCVAADRVIENVIGVFGLPLAIAPNFVVNGQDYIVPMAVEEPSIVAATSNAAKLARNSGGVEACCKESLLAGQIHVTDVTDPALAQRALEDQKDALIARANRVHPRLVERGGGVRDMEVRQLQLAGGAPLLTVHFLVDTCDAMGANLVNTLCEAIAPAVAELCGGDVRLRILSNLAERSLVRAAVRYRLADLSTAEHSAEAVRDGIIAASEIASADPHRAVTHNKGIMNGIDALALATANDWRAIEAGAHAYAARSGHYVPLATWSADSNGDLCGEIAVPLKVATVGGTLAANPAAQLSLRISGVKSAKELAELMAAVGLTQNFAALKALATSGIQEGHMRLHARSQTLTTGRPAPGPEPGTVPMGSAAGKVILLGEHAAVYGKHAVAVPIRDAVTANVERHGEGIRLAIPDWGINESITSGATPLGQCVHTILQELGVEQGGLRLEVHSKLPRAMGLGSSAAIAVALIRAVGVECGLDLNDERTNMIAFACEKLAHGTPSGVDNSVATFARPVLFQNAGKLFIQPIDIVTPAPIVIAFSSRPGPTMEQVAGVRARRDRHTTRYDALFAEIDALSLAGAKALANADYAELGALMNMCHGLLNAIEVSTAELEGMVSIARAAGAAGAKLTGSGGGGSIVALCPDSTQSVVAAFHAAGFATLSLAD